MWWGENLDAGVFRKNQFLPPSIGFIVTFHEGWKHQNTPQYVISAHPKKEAILLLGIVGPASDPEAAGAKLIERMRTKARVSMRNPEPTPARLSSAVAMSAVR
jgi:predicted Zn-dependent protease